MSNVYTAFSQALYFAANPVHSESQTGSSTMKQTHVSKTSAISKAGSILTMLVLLGAVSVKAQDSYQPLWGMNDADQALAVIYNVGKDVLQATSPHPLPLPGRQEKSASRATT